jgi:hypothetical protein
LTHVIARPTLPSCSSVKPKLGINRHRNHISPTASLVKRPPSLQGRHSASRPAQRNRVPRWITPDVVTISSHIIARWLGSAPFVDEAGHPRPLPRTAEAGAAGLSFDALVNSVTTDIRPPAVLEIWLSLELVRMESIDRVVLNADAFIPRPGESEQLFYFAREQAYRDLLESIRDRALRFLQMAPAMEAGARLR